MGHYASEMEPEVEIGPTAEWPMDNVARIGFMVTRSESEYGYRHTLWVDNVQVISRVYPRTFTPQDAARSLLREWLR